MRIAPASVFYIKREKRWLTTTIFLRYIEKSDGGIKFFWLTKGHHHFLHDEIKKFEGKTEEKAA